jgi:hypothetical protein
MREPHHVRVERPATNSVNCPPISSSRATVYSRTLHRACEVLGGMAQLSNHLNVPVSALTDWISGKEDPPLDVFLKAVDVVLLWAEGSRGTG